MPNKLKKLYHKAKKGLKNIVSPKKHKTVTKGQEAKISNDKPKPLSEIVVKPNLCSKVTSKAENVKKDKKGIKEKIKSFKTKKAKPVEKDLKKKQRVQKRLQKVKRKSKKIKSHKG